jgi:hypothetical protein
MQATAVTDCTKVDVGTFHILMAWMGLHDNDPEVKYLRLARASESTESRSREGLPHCASSRQLRRPSRVQDLGALGRPPTTSAFHLFRAEVRNRTCGRIVDRAVHDGNKTAAD